MTEEIRFEIDGNEYYFGKVDAQVAIEAQKVYVRTFKEALENGALLQKTLDAYMRKQGLWDDSKEKRYVELVKEIARLEFDIKNSKKVSVGRELAIKLRDVVRPEYNELINERNYLNSITAEGEADNAKFNYLVSACSYDFLTRKPVFSSFEDYKNKYSSEDVLAIKLATKFAHHLHGLPENYQDNLIENKFLKKFNLVNDKGFLKNKDGQLVDNDGRLIDEEGFYIDAKGNKIDINSNPIMEKDIDNIEFEDDYFTQPKKVETE